MFRRLRARSKLNNLGYKVKASREISMRYEVYKMPNENKCIGKILYHNGDWYFDDKKGPNAVGQLFFPTPEEAALWRYGHEFL